MFILRPIIITVACTAATTITSYLINEMLGEDNA